MCSRWSSSRTTSSSVIRSVTRRIRSTGTIVFFTTRRSSWRVTSSTLSAISSSVSCARSSALTGTRSTRIRSRTTGTRRSTCSVVTYLRSRARPSTRHSVLMSSRSSRQTNSTGSGTGSFAPADFCGAASPGSGSVSGSGRRCASAPGNGAAGGVCCTVGAGAGVDTAAAAGAAAAAAAAGAGAEVPVFGAPPVTNAAVRPAPDSGSTTGVPVSVRSTGFSSRSFLCFAAAAAVAAVAAAAVPAAAAGVAVITVACAGLSARRAPESAACWPLPVGTSSP